MRFTNICLEGPDCSGKTTMFNKLHELTSFKYNIQDRSCLSMFAYSIMYDREDKDFWKEKLHSELKRLETLYVVMIPSEEVLIKRINKRGDDHQDAESIKLLRKYFYNVAKFSLYTLPNVILLEDEGVDSNAEAILSRLNSLNEMKGCELIKQLVMNSGKNELIDVRCIERVNRTALDYSVLDFPEEKDYYHGIEEKIKTKLMKEFMGLNSVREPQKHESRRFVYSDDSCISFIHFLFRDEKLNVSATLRSSNVMKTLWADYEFLKILSCRVADELELRNIPIDLIVNIRSAHILP